MEELRVPTRQVEVEIVFANGSVDRGVFYLTDSPYPRRTAEELSEMLNDDRDFIPFGSGDSHTGQSLICKRHMLRVRAPRRNVGSKGESAAERAGRDSVCVVVFDDESRLAGTPIHPVPQSCSRLVDKVNQAPPFLAFLTADGLEFVHVAHIVRITTEE
jgi:hypothetical protein